MSRRLLVISLLALGASLAAQGQVRDEVAYANDARKIELYPNPTTDFLHVKFDEPQAKRVRVNLHNIIGNALEVEVEIIDDHQLRVKVKDLPTGYYFLALRDADTNNKRSFKFLKR
ncbi:MAG: T9SS type A sorting domain-containing protein [Cyclobacteriaceae bacterium]|jgi:hypothetical protein|nr:T9SS type A sorting domain-containing protein [Cyclobacteriaceae bacterium]